MAFALGSDGAVDDDVGFVDAVVFKLPLVVSLVVLAVGLGVAGDGGVVSDLEGLLDEE